MTRPRRLALALFCAAFLSCVTSAAEAATLTVDRTATVDTATTFRTITSALAAAKLEDTVFLRRDTYSEGFALKAGVIVTGEETAGTRLTGTVTWTNGATIQRVTFSGNGLTFASATSGTIRNNIFRDTGGTALKISGALQSPGTLVITNNTFFRNGTALDLTGSDDTVLAALNLFSNNTTAVQMDTTPIGAGPTIQRNHFVPDTQAVGDSVTSGDPLFVNPSTDPSDLDLHVKNGSPCEERGAYSGQFSDPTPSPVTGISATAPDDQGATTVTWDGNVAVGVSINQYTIRFKRKSDATTYASLSTLDVQDPELATYSKTVDLAPEAPKNVSWTPMDGGLRLSWTKDPRADGYGVHIATSPGGDPNGATVGADESTYEKTGLTNGTTYFVSVSSLASGDRFLTVTARSKVAGTPESRPADDSFKVTLPALEPALSEEKQAVPEKLQAYPALEDKGGCFLESAAIRTAGSRAAAVALGLFVVVLAGGLRRRRLPLWAGLALLAGIPTPNAQAGWATSASAGLFYPSDPDWARHFGERYMPDGKLSLGYLLVPQLEAGVDAGFRRDRGEVRTSSGQTLDTSVKQTLSVLPVQAYLLVNLRWKAEQWLVPYVAGGYSRLYYWSEIEDGEKVRGNQSGYHGRVGLKLLLNGLDPTSARNVRGRAGVQRTYALVEAQRSWMNGSDTAASHLDGTSYYGGICVEF